MKTSREQIELENTALSAVTRNSRVFLIWLAVATALVYALLALQIYAKVARFPATAFLGTTDAQAVCAPIGLDEPLVSDATARDFAVTAVRAMQTYDWTSWRDQINASTSLYMTPEGRANYRISINDWGIIKDVVANFQNATTVQRGSAQILARGVVDGQYSWRVHVPMTLIYRSSKDRRVENRDFYANVVRTPKSPLSPKGIAVGALVSTQPVTEGDADARVQATPQMAPQSGTP